MPIAISVIGGTALAETGAFNVSRLTQLQPSLQFYSTNPRNSAVNIRGLGAPFGLTNDGIEQGVGIYVDQVYYSRIAVGDVRLRRCRAGRGAARAAGHALRQEHHRRRDQHHDRAAELHARGARSRSAAAIYDFVQAKASVSGPLIADKLAIRLSASVTERDGHDLQRHDRQVRQRAGQSRRARPVAVASRPTTSTSRLSGDYSRQNPIAASSIYARTGATQRPLNRQFAALAAAFGYAPPSTNPFDRLTDLDRRCSAQAGDRRRLAASPNWDLGPATLTSVTAWRFWDWEPANDRDFTGLPITTVSANPSQQNQYQPGTAHRVERQAHARLRRSAPSSSTRRSTRRGLQVQGPAASRWLLNPARHRRDGCARTNACNPRAERPDRDQHIGFDNTSVAVFGQLDLARDRPAAASSPACASTTTRRAGSYRRRSSRTGDAAATDAAPRDQRGGRSAPLRRSYSPSSATGTSRATSPLSYDVAPDVLGYATYARSFKSGGINLSGLPLDANNNADPERADGEAREGQSLSRSA